MKETVQVEETMVGTMPVDETVPEEVEEEGETSRVVELNTEEVVESNTEEVGEELLVMRVEEATEEAVVVEVPEEAVAEDEAVVLVVEDEAAVEETDAARKGEAEEERDVIESSGTQVKSTVIV